MNPAEQLTTLSQLLKEVESEEFQNMPVVCRLGSANQGGKLSFALNGRLDIEESALIGNKEIIEALEQGNNDEVKSAIKKSYAVILKCLAKKLSQVSIEESKEDVTTDDDLEETEEDGSSET